MGKHSATQDAANAVAVATQAINDYGQNSPEARSAYAAAVDATRTAREQGATDNDLRATPPA